MNKIHVEYSQAVFISCVTFWGPVRENSSKQLGSVQVSMVDERRVLGFVWIAVQDIHFGLDLASRKQWFVA